MPELPEVETTKNAILPHLAHRSLVATTLRASKLRQPIPAELAHCLSGQSLNDIHRRGKYLLFYFSQHALIIHLGMSGHLQLLPLKTDPTPHSHLDLIFEHQILRYRDPRRFGLILLTTPQQVLRHPCLQHLGIEPLSAQLNLQWLEGHRHSSAKAKAFLMNARHIVGIGNIYASEILFRAKVHPLCPLKQLSSTQCHHLIESIQFILTQAIQSGGSSLKDFQYGQQQLGYFQQSHQVYQRDSEPCTICKTPIEKTCIAQRSSYFCPSCQIMPD